MFFLRLQINCLSLCKKIFIPVFNYLVLFLIKKFNGLFLYLKLVIAFVCSTKKMKAIKSLRAVDLNMTFEEIVYITHKTLSASLKSCISTNLLFKETLTAETNTVDTKKFKL